MSAEPLVDIGANLAHDSFDADREQVIHRAAAHGVAQMVITGSTEDSSEKAARLAQQSEHKLFSTAGIHPHHAVDFSVQSVSVLKDLLTLSHVVAVGETGLDFFRNYSAPSVQQKSFEAHLELAIELQAPLFLHCRDAHQRFIDILKSVVDHLPPAVLHCFTGSRSELHECLELDLHIGVTGWICDERRGTHLLEIVGEIPKDRLMVETDAPYILPRHLDPKPKDRRNEPMYLAHIVNRIAQASGQPASLVAQQTTTVARRFFNLAPIKQEALS
ncbi:MAG TPA: hydrolase TatD [Gammaproteobacteria bacterium]|nr:hydrolase TatD [Gammaproteobacteria bacterium]